MKWIVIVYPAFMICFFVFGTTILHSIKTTREEALHLTKLAGNRKLRCVSVVIQDGDYVGKAFYLIEEGAESDHTKFVHKIIYGMPNSATSVKEAQKHTEAIIKNMPYNLWICDTGISEEVFFEPRKISKMNAELEKDILDDERMIRTYLIPDLRDKELTIVRFNNTITDHTGYDYLLKCKKMDEEKYIKLFYPSAHQVAYPEKRLTHFIEFFNGISTGTKIDPCIRVTDIELNDFLERHPYYTILLIYRNYTEIERFYAIGDE